MSLGYEDREYFESLNDSVRERKKIKLNRRKVKSKPYNDECKSWVNDDYKGEFTRPVRFVKNLYKKDNL
jgi:hypothetical protein